MPTTEPRLAQYAQEMFPSYVECALWASNDMDTGKPLDDAKDIGDIAPASQAMMFEDIRAFVRKAGELLDDITPEQAGHDFWLTRNRHGAGFWDRGLGEIGERLTDIAHGYGESYLYVGDDGRVYVD